MKDIINSVHISRPTLLRYFLLQKVYISWSLGKLPKKGSEYANKLASTFYTQFSNYIITSDKFPMPHL
jgi:hypothetical protein